MIILSTVVGIVLTEIEFSKDQEMGISHAFQRGTTQWKGPMAEACLPFQKMARRPE